MGGRGVEGGLVDSVALVADRLATVIEPFVGADAGVLSVDAPQGAARQRGGSCAGRGALDAVELAWQEVVAS